MFNQTLTINFSHRIYRMAVGAVFFLYGMCFASWASRIPSIQQRLGLSGTSLGLVLITLPIGSMLSLPLAGWLTAKAGSRKIVIIAGLLNSMTLVSLGLGQNVPQLDIWQAIVKPSCSQEGFFIQEIYQLMFTAMKNN